MPPERKSRIEREREQREATWIEDATKRLVDSGTAVVEGDGGRNIVASVLRTVVNVLTDRAALHAEIKRQGWQSGQAAATSAASHVQVLVGMVETYIPPADIAEVAEIGRLPADPVAHRDRLADTFGPNLDTPTYSEIQRRTEREIDGAVPTAAGEHDIEHLPVCTMGPACPVHPGIEVIHPVDAPADAVVGPEGGTEPLPRDDAPTGMDPSAAERLAALPDVTGTMSIEEHAGELVINILRDPSEAPPGTVVHRGFGIEQTEDGYVMHLGPEVGSGRYGDIVPAMPAMSDANAPAPVRKRLTYAEMYARRAAAPPADHRSVSQIQAAASCGVKLALYREPEVVPSWWFVAGTALHTAIEDYERAWFATADPDTTVGPWNATFYAEIDKVREATGVPTDRWRAARGGAEGYDWWRVEGEAMLKRYIEWSTEHHADGWSILTVGDVPVLEYPFRLDVQGIPVDGFIDQAWINVANNEQPIIEIIDLKFGSGRPDDRFQLGVYAHALALAIVGAHSFDQVIGGAYYLGRKGELYGHTDDLRTVVPWDDVVHRTVVTDMMDRGGLFLPRRSSFCKSCGVNDLCPAGAS